MRDIQEMRAAVADALEKRGHGNRAFLADIREGRRDDCPFMIGARAWVERQRAGTAR